MPALTVVGEIVRLRDKLRWYDKKPLFGQRVLVTRAREQSESLAQALREAGAAAIEIPMISIRPPLDLEPLRAAIRKLSEYTFLVFTSQNGVSTFFAELAAIGGDSRALGGLRVAAIGPGTAEALVPFGIKPDVVPDNFRGEALAKAIMDAVGSAHDMRGVRILLPRAAVARDVLPDTLRAAGAEVDVITAYETHGASPEARAELRGLLERRELDVITFTASSTVQHTLEALAPDGRELLRGLTLASIGPITTQTAHDHGLEVQVTAEEYTIEGLVHALHQHFTSNETP